MKRLAILTGGGDAPGLNAVIRAAVKTVYHQCDCEILGVKDGFDGFLETGGVNPLTQADVRGILPRGGTILGTANRGNPFAREVIHNGQVVIEDLSGQIIDAIHALNLDVLIVVGGDGTLRIANELFQKGVPVVGVPKTIDNDIYGTDFSFGFDTAVNIASEAIDRLHTTAESHHRVMVLELMGRDAGFIALHAGMAGGADVILIPEIPFHLDAICYKIQERVRSGSHFSIVAVAEGARPFGKEQVFAIPGSETYAARLGGVGNLVGKYINDLCGIETRVIVLGHLQRGGSPTAFDRQLATRLGSAAVRLALNNGFGRMVALQGQRITDISLDEALSVPKRVDIHGDTLQTARALGIAFGDETLPEEVYTH
ncbi:6-phosphofructokinase [Ornatilinea apprima]|uniref:6-phosphofructokinase n=1 Tax=Ornatilinea apprima TaxID=1134406 RepID=UPI0009EA0924|nr:ATP-dependent 6-phosphofructokinase [Ornatilinea apprima]